MRLGAGWFGNFHPHATGEEVVHKAVFLFFQFFQPGKLGIDYFISPKWKLSGSGYQSIQTEESNEVDFAFTLGLTRFFGGD